MRILPDLQPGDSVRLKLDQQKGWKTAGKVIARSLTPRSYVVQTPLSVVRRNRRHPRPATSPGRLEIPDKHDLDQDSETPAEPDQLPQIVKPCRLIPTVTSSAETQSSLPQLGPQVVVSLGNLSVLETLFDQSFFFL